LSGLLTDEARKTRGIRILLFATIIGLGVMATNAKAAPQVGIAAGVAPDCPYGYYDVPPYTCAPYGYYGPE
jgi:hypothetical protein